MVGIGFAGAAVTPLVTFTGYALYRDKEPASSFTVMNLLDQTGLYLAVLIGTPLFGVLATWLFNREFVERTLKEMLSIPIPRARIVAAKLAVLFLWIVALCAWSWALTVALGYAGGFAGCPASVLGRYFLRYLAEGGLLFLLTTPIVLATLLFRNYVPVIVLTVAITLVSVVVGNSEYRAVFPWAAILPVLTGKYPAEFPTFAPIVSILTTSVIGTVGSFIALGRMDIS